MSTFTQPAGSPLSGRELARYIDHTLLKPEATEAQFIQLCEEARRYTSRRCA
jgi:deoxyribose-phosphate aldolase